MQWDTKQVTNYVVYTTETNLIFYSGIKVFFFERGSIPSDIASGSPNPTGWGNPNAFWPATDCNPFQYFKQHTFIFDTTLWCGLNILVVLYPLLTIHAVVTGLQEYGGTVVRRVQVYHHVNNTCRRMGLPLHKLIGRSILCNFTRRVERRSLGLLGSSCSFRII